MALFTQQQCDDCMKISREKNFESNGTFLNYRITIYDENGWYYEYTDTESLEGDDAATTKSNVHNYSKANLEFVIPPDNTIVGDEEIVQ